MNNTFKVGDRVVLPEYSNLESYNEYEDDCTRGEVTGVNSNGKITVKWDSSWQKPNPSSHDADELMTEVEADDILSKLEAEYEAWAAPIREKMEQAALLLKEAGGLAQGQNKHITELHDIIEPLMSAMRGVGWSTSSLSC